MHVFMQYTHTHMHSKRTLSVHIDTFTAREHILYTHPRSQHQNTFFTYTLSQQENTFYMHTRLFTAREHNLTYAPCTPVKFNSDLERQHLICLDDGSQYLFFVFGMNQYDVTGMYKSCHTGDWLMSHMWRATSHLPVWCKSIYIYIYIFFLRNESIWCHRYV